MNPSARLKLIFWTAAAEFALLVGMMIWVYERTAQ
jgi:hypothetical protein